MLVALAVALFVNAAYNVIVWPRFLGRIAKDPRSRAADGSRTTFYRVHLVLITIALVIAAVSAILGVVALVVGT
ncbi:hypothetical protein ELQ90_07530 [Labedella phragmitis]|uniref:Uncharacterized protein n=1 Tax=Labedella phragmitis TaxID=2498849 RepID=A0A3S4BK28_9MICO|nr:hypothetical protein [Labedella phragmitis]RWZ51920.1 hypothetical protein ELQ90_07530 [Labedella phragmitis]